MKSTKRFPGLAYYLSRMHTRSFPRFLAVVALLFAFSPLHAQTGDRDDDDDLAPTDVKNTAYLRVDAESGPYARINLTTNKAIDIPEEVRGLLLKDWNCKPETMPDGARFYSGLSQEQLKRIEKLRAALERRTISCKSELFNLKGSVRQGQLDVSALSSLLQQGGMQELQVNISLPPVTYHEITVPSNWKEPSYSPALRATGSNQFGYEIDLTQVNPGSAVVKFGYLRSDVVRMAALSSLFILIPVGTLLCVRRMALKRGTQDPAAAWFSYMKTFQWCVNGVFLLWGGTQINPRHDILELMQFAGWNSGWRLVCANVGVVMLPSWTAYVLCTLISYKVFIAIRNVSWSRLEFLKRQFVQMGKVFFPLSLWLAAILTFGQNSSLGFALVIVASCSSAVFKWLALKLSSGSASAITSGPLRDRIFELAKQMQVKLTQVFVLKASESGVANAFATTKQTVVFTDYLVEKLSQREVDAVAAHELTHLRHKHAQKLRVLLLAIIFGPRLILEISQFIVMMAVAFTSPAFLLKANHAIASKWAEALALCLIFWAYYQIQQRFEYTADAGSVAATRDPEAMITALVKISRLNLMPLQYGRGAEAMSTHPSTMRRLERIADVGGIARQRLPQLIADAGDHRPQLEGGSRYSVAADATGAVSTRETALTAQRNLWILLLMHVLPALGVAWAAQKYVAPGHRGWFYLGGIAVSFTAYRGVQHLLRHLKTRSIVAQARLALSKSGASLRPEQGILVGFSPGAVPRFYVSSYNWDYGYLFLTAEKAVFFGGHSQFSLSREQIHTVVLGSGAPAWGQGQRVYFSWRETQYEQPAGSFSMARVGRNSANIAKNFLVQVRSWRNGQTGIEGAELPDVKLPKFGEVTSLSPKKMGRFSKWLSTTFTLLVMALVSAEATRVHNMLYVVGTVLMLRLVEGIPYWLYREKPAVLEKPWLHLATSRPGRPQTLKPAPEELVVS